MVRIAEIDRAILAELRKNGRMSYVELAKLVGASERTVRTHVRAWKKWELFVDTQSVKVVSECINQNQSLAEIGTFAGEVTGWEGVEILFEVSGELKSMSSTMTIVLKWSEDNLQ